MPQRFEAALKYNRPTLFVAYPADFMGEKSGDESDESFCLGVAARYLTEDELNLAEELCRKLPYPQSVVKTGAILLDKEDPLLQVDHDYLDGLEQTLDMPSTRSVGDGTREVSERVLLIREAGYRGSGHKLSLAAN